MSDEYIKIEDAIRMVRLQGKNAQFDGMAQDVAPVRHGKWIELAMKGEFKCSVCGRGSKSENTFQLIPTVYWNYCPNCGARMDGEK